MIKQESIETLKSLINITDIVGNYIQLKKQGTNFKAPCPFHNENTPSFVVSPVKQIYHCFGCGVSGNAITFVMEYEKLSYKEALEKIADYYNFKLEYTRSSGGDYVNIKMLDSLNGFYKQQLAHHAVAKNYLKERGMFESAIEKFEIGYAPSNNMQHHFLKESLFSVKEAMGLGILNETGEYARLIERITFPIHSSNGKLIAFGGRTITNHPAKYINYTNTKLFNKSKTFYGLNFAREKILRTKKAYIVEGYMDVIMLHQAGFTNAVATLGTALTPSHLPILQQLETEVILAYDGDSAGVEAAFKASKLLASENFKGGVILFAQGIDPADMIKNREDVAPLFNNATPFSEFIFEQIIKKNTLNTPQGKEQAYREMKEFISSLPAVIQRDTSVKAARLLQVSTTLFEVDKVSFEKVKGKIDLAEASIIKTLFEEKELIDFCSSYIRPDVFKTHNTTLQSLFEEVYDASDILRLALNDTVQLLNKEDLIKQMVKLLIPFYQKKLLEVKSTSMTIEEKAHINKRLFSIIKTLKQGELVEYQSSFTF